VDANANVVFLVDKNGQQIAATGGCGRAGHYLPRLAHRRQCGCQPTASPNSSASASSPSSSTRGRKTTSTSSIVGGKVILVVIFDERSSLVSWRLRVKRSSDDLGRVFQQILEKTEREKASGKSAFESPFAEITDEDMLFPAPSP